MAGRFSLQEQVSYYRNRCTVQAREINSLKSEKGLDVYRRKCEEEANQKNKALTKELQQKDIEIKRLNLDVQKLKAEIQKLSGTIDQLKTELKEQGGDNARIQELEKQLESLGVQVEKAERKDRQNSQTSSSPTSHFPYSKPVQNSRTPTEKSAGAQEGHPHNGRTIAEIPGKAAGKIWGDDDPLWNDPEYEFVEYKVKHVARSEMVVIDEYVLVPVFRNIRTRIRKCAEYPSWMKDDVNYSPEVKAMIVYMTTFANAAVRKTGDIMRSLSHGSLRPSTGFISGLSTEFALKSEPERALAFQKMLGPGVMNVDGTTIRVNGEQYAVSICISGSNVLYCFRAYKGKKLVEGTPIENTAAILVHDHDVTYYNYGGGHQECLEHVCRYLRDSIATEGEYLWNTKMLEFIQKLMHLAKKADRKRAGQDVLFESTSDSPTARFSDEMIQSFRQEFLEISGKGMEEYEKQPNKKWYPDGKNLCKRLNENPEAYLLFLEDDRVPYTNNRAEGGARKIKRKQAGAMTFRGFLSVIAYCEALSVIEMLKQSDKEVLPMLAEIFARETNPADELRIQKEKLAVLQGVCEKDASRVEKKQAGIKKLQDSLPEAEEAAKAARKGYTDAVAARAARHGGDSQPSEEELHLEAVACCAERRYYDLEMKIRDEQAVLDKKIKAQAKNKADMAAAEARIKFLEKKTAAKAKSKETEKQSDKEPQQQKNRIIDPERVTRAQESVELIKAELGTAINELSCTCSAYNAAAYPGIDPKSVSKSAVTACGKSAEKAESTQLKALKEAYLKVQHKVVEAQEKLTVAMQELDDAKKGRRPGRRTRKKVSMPKENRESA